MMNALSPYCRGWSLLVVVQQEHFLEGDALEAQKELDAMLHHNQDEHTNFGKRDGSRRTGSVGNHRERAQMNHSWPCSRSSLWTGERKRGRCSTKKQTLLAGMLPGCCQSNEIAR
jgi:hypothetical protein